MRERVSSSWLLFFLMTLGVMLLMIGSRPGLQPIAGREAPGPTIRLVGHGLAWTSAAVLGVRMIRSTRAALREEQVERERSYQRAIASGARAAAAPEDSEPTV